jgi:hypothetical protein
MRENLQFGLVEILLDALGLIIAPAIRRFAGLDDGIGLGVVALVFNHRQYHREQGNGDCDLFAERIVGFRNFRSFGHDEGE